MWSRGQQGDLIIATLTPAGRDKKSPLRICSDKLAFLVVVQIYVTRVVQKNLKQIIKFRVVLSS